MYFHLTHLRSLFKILIHLLKKSAWTAEINMHFCGSNLITHQGSVLWFRYFCQKKSKYCTLALIFQCISNLTLNSCYYYFFYGTSFMDSLLQHALKNLHEVICYFSLWFQRRKLWKKFKTQLTNEWQMPETELTQNMRIGVSNTAHHYATVIPTDLYIWISSAEHLFPHLRFQWTPRTA